MQEIEKAYRDLFHWLAGAQIDFDYGDEEMMSRLCRIEPDENGQTVLGVGQAPYRAALVGKMSTIRADTLVSLYNFHRAGGKVIFAGEAPAYVDAFNSALAQSVAERVIHCNFDRDCIVSAVKKHVRTPVEIADGTSGESLTDIFCQMRVDGDRAILIRVSLPGSRTRPRSRQMHVMPARSLWMSC